MFASRNVVWIVPILVAVVVLAVVASFAWDTLGRSISLVLTEAVKWS
ncbi:hypothetical protein LCGC14_1666930 [marine sediment metagenome]|uniref:Uncharacterized protein n=1 Tax=marine sediment metagenome TaxID=412755 RepID=A0A0F9IF04_9ZZZZ